VKICMFTNTYLPHVGGVANSVSRFTRDLRRMGHHVLVIAPTFSKTGKKAPDEDRVLRVPAIQNFNGSDFSVRIPVPFIIDETMDDFEPDIIHSHHPYLLGDTAVRAARRRGLPIVFTHHTRYEEYTHYVTENNKLMKRFAANLSTAYANLCDHVIAPSQSIAELISRRGVKTPVTVIPTGVDRDLFGIGRRDEGRHALEISRTAEVIGHVGRLAREKNIPFLAQAVARHVKDTPDAVFLVVGDGPARADILCIFEDAGVADRLILAGKQTGQALADAYAAMDVFVFASKTETQGMVLTEAMAAGIPVIAVDAPGVREVVQEHRNGRRLPEDASADTFAGAIRDFFRESDRRKQWKENAYQTAAQFDRRVCAEHLAAAYRRLLEKKAASEKSEPEAMTSWNNLLNAIKAEWGLAAEKAKALSATVMDNNIQERD